MISASSKARSGAAAGGRVFLVFLGCCAVMLIYVSIYGMLESSAVRVAVSPFLDVNFGQWDTGYFNAKGSFRNISAENDGDELTLQTNDITCLKNTNTCTITTADEFHGFMDLEIRNYNIDLWNAKQITFSDTSSICANWVYVIDRAAQSINGLGRKKPIIPDYALKSPLHPCDNMKDEHLSLVRGDQVYNQKIKSFEAKNGLSLHLFLALLNLVYFALVARWDRRRRQRKRANELEPA